MKKLILLLMVGSLFAQYLPDVSKMSEIEKMHAFAYNKKSPELAVGFTILLPTSGYAYAGNWEKGLLFLGGRIVSLIAVGVGANNQSISPDDKHPEITLGTIGYLSLTLAELINVNKEITIYNNKLYKQIFGKEPSSISFNLQPDYQGANLTMSFALD